MPENNQTPEVQPSAPAPAPALRDKRVLPEGVVPKQAQGYVIAGLAVLILMAVMFSKNHTKPAPKDTSNSPLAVSNEMNQKKIQQLEQDLSADERQNAQARQMAANNAVPGTDAAPVQTVPMMMPPPQTASAPPADPVADAEKELAFKSRFVSNLVTDQAPHIPMPSDDDSPSDTASAAHAAAPPQSTAPAPQSAADTAKKRAPEVNVNNAHGQPYVVFEGTTIDTVLANRLDGEFAGPLKVMVTNPVYSHDGQHLLIPEGTFILGDVQKVGGLGQKRLAVTFHRLLMPDGYSVDLDQFHGLDQVGDTGLKDKVNNHYVEIFGASIALGLISGVAEVTNLNEGFNETGSEAYKAGIASSLSQSSANVLDRFINIPPTITIREGHRIKVYITQDMLLPAYENHSVPSNF
jgi:type IV secretion system protein TrbI